MQQYETANIVYKGLTDGKLTVTLLDDKKGKWTIWKKAYQSNEDSEVYQALQNYKFGDTFGVSYQEKEETFTNDQGKQITFKKRTIYSIMPPLTNPTNTLKTSKSAPGQEIQYKPDTDWDEIAVGKCQSLFIAAYLQSGKSFSEAKLQVTQARQLAELVVYGHTIASQVDTTDEAPPIEDPGF